MTEKKRGVEVDFDDSGPQAVGTKYLLVIAIDTYDPASGYGALRYPVSDAEDLARLLETEYGFAKEKIFYLLNDKASDSQIREQILDLKEGYLKPEDQLVVFFAGHGTVVGKIGYWIPYNANKRAELNLSVSLVLESLIGCCSQVLLIVDCCFSGATTARAYSQSLFSDLEYKQSTFQVISAGNMYQTVPDHSLFMKTLLELLRVRNITSFEGLVGDLKAGLQKYKPIATVTSFTSDDQAGLRFLLQREDKLSFELTNDLFYLNYKEQINRIAGAPFINMTYLRGAKTSGHHIFTHRFFRQLGKDVSMFNYIPYTISFGHDARSSDYSLWTQLAKLFNLTSPDPATIINLLLKEVESKNWVLIVRIDHCATGELQKALMAFWQEVLRYLNENKSIKRSANGIYIFLWDLRGDSEMIEDILTSTAEDQIKPYGNPKARLLPLGPVRQLKEEDLSDWCNDIVNRDGYICSESCFDDFHFEKLKPPYSIENVICQIADFFDRPEVYDNLFIKKNLWKV